MSQIPNDLAAWASRYDWAVTTEADCLGHQLDDPPGGWALYDAGEDDPPIAVFDQQEEAMNVAAILRIVGGVDTPRPVRRHTPVSEEIDHGPLPATYF